MHPYSSNEHQIKLYGLLATMSVLLSIVLTALADGLGLGPAWLVSAPTVAGSYALTYNLFNSIGWKMGVFRSFGLSNVPVVEGKYEGKLISNYRKNGKRVELKTEIVIEQSWSRLVVHMKVNSSTSKSVMASLNTEGPGRSRLFYTYRNQVIPTASDEDMSDHTGTAEVVISDDGSLNGRYFNGRRRVGKLDLSKAS